MQERELDQGSERVRRFRADSSVDDIRRFVLDQIMSPRVAAGGRQDSVRVTIRLLPGEVEITVGGSEGPAQPGSGFADWFLEVLRGEGITQQDAARRLGVSGKTVNRWVRGHTEPRLRELRRVRAVFGASPPL
jgi:DNA-binding XRE family transcriptional regulator